MARTTLLAFHPTGHHGPTFRPPNPIGIVCHRTEVGYKGALTAFTTGHRGVSAHFLIGKATGNAVQLVDTNTVAYHVGPGANGLYIGIEFESIAARPEFEHRTDPRVNADPLTPFQIDVGRRVIDWLCKTHNIPRSGPPSREQLRAVHGRYHGLLNHADLAGFFHTDHGDRLRPQDWRALLPITGQLGDFPELRPRWA
jgi:N-acetylmuramoyl-L-alanine amidase-like protein